ncbi:MAG: phosphoribosylglycinamide formyltransferase [Clostridia bacterium]|nr:phosphoribosylglycinamide formyltransferase [Clostridia bacterium]
MKNGRVKIAVLVSGGGTNLQALIDAEKSGVIKSGEIVVVISDREGVYALERAKAAGIAAITLSKKALGAEFESRLTAEIDGAGAEIIVLAGFTSILSGEFTARYKDRIINVHPSLIPSFCGKGFYGLKVHQAVLRYGVKVTGATVHFVNEIPDGGKIIMQKAVEIKDGDDAETLQKRVMREAEWKILPAACEKVCAELIADCGRR